MEKEVLTIDRTAFSVTSPHEQLAEEKQYWLDRTPHERLQVVETLQQIVYGYDPTATRLQRIFEVAERARS